MQYLGIIPFKFRMQNIIDINDKLMILNKFRIPFKFRVLNKIGIYDNLTMLNKFMICTNMRFVFLESNIPGTKRYWCIWALVFFFCSASDIPGTIARDIITMYQLTAISICVNHHISYASRRTSFPHQTSSHPTRTNRTFPCRLCH